jgi:DNA transformation protein
MPAKQSAGAARPVDPFVAHCLELLGSIGRTRSRAMFGGHGLYVDDLFIALIAEDRLYLKVDASTEPRFRAAGCQQWVYTGGARPMPMGYWSAPDEAMDAPALMAPWARLASQAAMNALAAKSSKASKATTPHAARPAKKPAAKPAAGPATKPARMPAPTPAVKASGVRASAPKRPARAGAAAKAKPKAKRPS